MDPTMKWTGLALVFIAVAGIALWNWAGPAPMQGQNPYGMGSLSVQQAPGSGPSGYGRGGGMNGMAQGHGGFWGSVGRWWNERSGRMMSWMQGMGMMGGGMQGGMAGAGCTEWVQ